MTFKATLAVPGAISTMTGGSIYDRRVMEALRAAGHDIGLVTLPDGFPFPGEAGMAEAMACLSAAPPDRPLIVDGLALGALPTAALDRITAPLVALVHHPLALETALPAAEVRHLWQTERDNLGHARHVLVPSPHTRDMLVTRYEVAAERITVALPGTDQPAIAARREDRLSPPLILSVGILHPRKGHDVLIAALALITALPWQAVIVGNPWDQDHAAALAAQIVAEGLAGRVTLAGRVPDAARDALYRGATLFALATRYEGYGIVFNEAFAHGLPVVSCRTGAVPDTVPAAAGLLVPPEDPAAFAAAMRRVLTDAALRDGMAAAALHHGAALPAWADTAAVFARVLRAVQTANPA